MASTTPSADPFDRAGNRHMEYVNKRGVFGDLPLECIVTDFKKVHGALMVADAGLQAGDFMADVERETAPKA